MVTITIDDDVWDGLLRISAELQLRLGRRVDHNDVLRYLMECRAKRPELLDRAVVRGWTLRSLYGSSVRSVGETRASIQVHRCHTFSTLSSYLSFILL